MEVIRGSRRHKCENPGDFSSSPDADCQEQLQWCSINLNFSSEKVFSKFAKQKIPRKSIAMDVAFQKVLLETMRSKLARVFALPG
jgi:hypothetical protein